MPTLPTRSLFDKDLSLRSPFPRHVATVSHTPASPLIRPSHTHGEARIVYARTDYSQIKRPTPVKAKSSASVFDLQLPQSDVPHSLRTLMHHPVCPNKTYLLQFRNLSGRTNGQMLIGNWIECILLVLCQRCVETSCSIC